MIIHTVNKVPMECELLFEIHYHTELISACMKVGCRPKDIKEPTKSYCRRLAKSLLNLDMLKATVDVYKMLGWEFGKEKGINNGRTDEEIG